MVRLAGMYLRMMLSVFVVLSVPVRRTSTLLDLLCFRIWQLLKMPIDRGARFRRLNIGTFDEMSSLIRGRICDLFLSPIVRVLDLPTNWVVAVRVRLGEVRQELKGRLVTIRD